jgi:MipA family protein
MVCVANCSIPSVWTCPSRSRCRRQLHLLLPVRAAFTLGGRPESIGWVAHPKLNLDITNLAAMPGWNLGLQAGPLLGDRRQHAYFYDVDAAYATASRPAYRASGGYAGMQMLMALSKRYPGYWVGAFVRYDNLQGAGFADSPLVRTPQYFAAGFAVSWMLGESATQVMTND